MGFGGQNPLIIGGWGVAGGKRRQLGTLHLERSIYQVYFCMLSILHCISLSISLTGFRMFRFALIRLSCRIVNLYPIGRRDSYGDYAKKDDRQRGRVWFWWAENSVNIPRCSQRLADIIQLPYWLVLVKGGKISPGWLVLKKRFARPRSASHALG